MRRKLKGNNRLCINLRKEKFNNDKELVKSLGGKTREYKGIVKDTRRNCNILKEELRKKNAKKMAWLEKKYAQKYDMSVDMTKDEREKYGMSEILSMECEITADKLREPEIVRGMGEILELTDDEKKVLALGPKFCVRKKLLKKTLNKIKNSYIL